MCLQFVRSHAIPETAVRVYRRYVMVAAFISLLLRPLMWLQLNRSATEDYIEYLIQIKRYDTAAVHLVDIINDEKYVSTKNKSKHQVWTRTSCIK